MGRPRVSLNFIGIENITLIMERELRKVGKAKSSYKIRFNYYEWIDFIETYIAFLVFRPLEKHFKTLQKFH